LSVVSSRPASVFVRRQVEQGIACTWSIGLIARWADLGVAGVALLRLDRAGISTATLAVPGLLEHVPRNESVMFSEAATSDETAILVAIWHSLSREVRDALARDYAATAEILEARTADPLSFYAGLRSVS
jgi:hypothetical protein